MLSKETQELCRLFADVLEYPSKSLAESASNCVRELQKAFPALAEPMQSFGTFVRSQSLAALEELYTQTFDVTPVTSLYLGYHLFGETPKRSVFLVKLQEAYEAHSFSSGMELADHLGVLLRFLSVTRDREFAGPLLEECLVPTVTMMEEELKKNKNEYAPVISALRMLLEQVSRRLAKTGGGPHA